MGLNPTAPRAVHRAVIERDTTFRDARARHDGKHLGPCGRQPGVNPYATGTGGEHAMWKRTYSFSRVCLGGCRTRGRAEKSGAESEGEPG